jgi:hypothetical protein
MRNEFLCALRNWDALARLFVVLCVMALAGCIPQPQTILPGRQGFLSGPPSVVRSQDRAVSIIKVDGQSSVSRLNFALHNSQFAGQVTIPSGDHEIIAAYNNLRVPHLGNPVYSWYMFGVTTNPGRTYEIRYERAPQAASLWIEEPETHQHVGKILASRNEPILDPENRLTQSMLFTFAPLHEPGWTVDIREGVQTVLSKEGESRNERSIISIHVTNLPKLTSEKEFLAWFKETQESSRRDNGYDKEYKTLDNGMELFSGRRDYCVKYHTLSENKTPTKIPFMSSEPDMSEVIGYICRHPDNKNFGINFGYIHKYEKGMEDPELDKKAADVFGRVDF